MVTNLLLVVNSDDGDMFYLHSRVTKTAYTEKENIPMILVKILKSRRVSRCKISSYGVIIKSGLRSVGIG